MQNKTLLLSTAILVFALMIVGSYVLGSESSLNNPGHSWNEMDCDTTMCVSSSNSRVGIGTTAPSDKLEVSGGNVAISNGYYFRARRYTNNDLINVLGFDARTDNLFLRTGGSSASNRFGIIRTDSTEIFTILNSGNVGIGTTSPGAKLEVRGGDLRLNGSLKFTDSSGNVYKDNWIGMANNIDGTTKWLHIGGITDTDSVRRIALYADRVYFPGYVGIGTRSPSSRLTVVSPDSRVGTIGIGGGYNYDISYNGGDEADFLFTYTGNHPNGATVFTYNPSGTRNELMKIYNNGNVWVKGTVTASSSIKHKKNLENYNGQFLNKIKNLQPYLYNLKTEKDSSKKHFGYLSENLPKEILTEDGDVDMMAYNGMLLRLIQEQQQEIENQQKEIEKLQEEIKQLKKSNNISNEKKASFWNRIFGR